MSRCDRCDKDSWASIGGHEFGYKSICLDCNKELVKQRDMKTAEQLKDDAVLHSLNAEQIVKNFIHYFAEYKKNPSQKLLDILWRIMCWAAHEDHTASCAIHEIMKWQNFNFITEEERWENE